MARASSAPLPPRTPAGELPVEAPASGVPAAAAGQSAEKLEALFAEVHDLRGLVEGRRAADVWATTAPHTYSVALFEVCYMRDEFSQCICVVAIAVVVLIAKGFRSPKYQLSALTWVSK